MKTDNSLIHGHVGVRYFQHPLKIEIWEAVLPFLLTHLRFPVFITKQIKYNNQRLHRIHNFVEIQEHPNP